MTNIVDFKSNTIRISNEEVKAIFENKEGIGFIPTFLMDELLEFQADAAKRYFKANPEADFYPVVAPLFFDFEHHFPSLKRDLTVVVFADFEFSFHYDAEDDELSSGYSLLDFKFNSISFNDEGDDVELRLAEPFEIKQSSHATQVDNIAWYVRYFMPTVMNNLAQFIDLEMLNEDLAVVEATVKDSASSFNINLDVNPENASIVQDLLNKLAKNKAPNL
jgi:hypothetical protein